MDLTEKEYQAILNLYNEYHDAFLWLPDYIKDMFWKRIYAK